MNNDELLLAVLMLHLDASDRQLQDANVSREDVLRTIRAFCHVVGEERLERLGATGIGIMRAYRQGRMDAIDGARAIGMSEAMLTDYHRGSK